jgi:methyl-accepting chemotaxis protein
MPDETALASPAPPVPEPHGERVPLLQKLLIGDVLLVGLFAAMFLFYGPAAALLGEFKEIVFIAVGIIVAALVAVVLDRVVVGRVRHLNASAEGISRGDLSQPVVLPEGWRFGHDEVDELAAAIGEMQVRLRELVAHVQRTSRQVAQSASGLLGSTQAVSHSTGDVARAMAEITRGAEQQLRLVEEAERVIAGMARLVRENAARAAEAAASSERTRRAVLSGGDAAQTAGEKIRGVFGRIEGASEVVFAFGEKTKEISDVVDAFTMVSQQTQLLALNAAIEAARAGEYGRGFGVVAEEVRRLADSAGRSAERISRLVGEISERSTSAVEAMRTGIDELSEGRGALDRIIGALDDVARAAAAGAAQAESIGAAARAQEDGAQAMVASVTDIGRVARENAASTERVSSSMRDQATRAEEMSRAAQDLARLSRELESVVSRFKLE